MKVFKLVSLVMAIAMMFTVLQMPAFAEEAAPAAAEEEITFIFEEGVSEEMQKRIIAHLIGEESPSASTYGLTCTLFGHKLETTYTTTITHKAKTTAPRCLQKEYEVETCTRCDYTSSTLISQSYIYCCS